MMAMWTIIAVLFVFQQTEIREVESLVIERRPLVPGESQTGRAVDWEQDTKTSAEREEKTLTATFIGRFNHSDDHYGFTTVEDKIYVVNQWPHRIRVFDGQTGFRFIKEISLRGTIAPKDIVYSSESKCVYISDREYYLDKGGSIWKMTTTDDHRLTKWLTNVAYMSRFTISLSSEGHLLVLKHGPTPGQNILEIYAPNATLIRIIHLPKEFPKSYHIVQASTGEFVTVHNLKNSYYSFISRLTNDGELINRFDPGNQSEEYHSSYFGLSLDSENNRLFVAAPFSEFHVIVLDSIDLTSIKIIGLDEMKNSFRLPSRLLYDPKKKQLFVEHSVRFVVVFEIA